MLIAFNLPAQTIYVDGNTGDDARTGLDDWTNAVKTISNGVSLAETGYTVLVATGTYYVATNILVGSAITIRSWNAGDLDPSNTVIDGQSATRCMHVYHPGVWVAGFTLRNGNSAVGYGGGIYLGRGVLSNCFLHHNTAVQRGGGIYIGLADALAVDCAVYSNTVSPTGDRGGGGVLVNAGELRNSSVFENGCVTRGGGVFVMTDGMVRGCSIYNNSANEAGGVYCGWHSVGSAVSNRIYGNVATNYGGGIFCGTVKKGSLLAYNMVSGNTSQASSYGGGGIGILPGYTGDGGVVVSNCWIVDNVVSNAGGGICTYVASANYTNTDILITHCLISGNEVRSSSASPGARGGGGVYLGAPGRIEYSSIISNRAPWSSAGGVCLHRQYATYSSGAYDDLTMRNCLIADNQAAAGGGVLFNACDTNKAVRLENCTVAGNAATNYAGGVWFYQSTNATMTNTIAYHNSAPEDENIRTNNAEYALGYCCVTPTNHLSLAGALVNVTTNDPVFSAWQSGNFRLGPGSPGINAGFNQEWALLPGALDLDGRPRLDRLFRQLDLGCYEHIPRGTFFGVR